jgi:hypothetical protein
VVGNRVFTRVDVDGTLSRVELTGGYLGDARAFSSRTGWVAMENAGFSADEVIISDAAAAHAEGLSGGRVYRYDNAATPLALLTDLSITSKTITQMDGYLIRDDDNNAGRFIYSGIYDAATENPFAYASADGSPDDLIAVIASRRELWLFGTETTEIWYNSGDANNPFARFQGGFHHVGCAAPSSVRRFDNSIIWLGQNDRGGRVVYMAGDNFSPQAISPSQINHQLNQYSVVHDAEGHTLTWQGHPWYVLHFPTQDITWVYDSLTKNWHQWMSGPSGGYHIGVVTYRWSPAFVTNSADTFLNNMIVGDSVYRQWRNHLP